MAEDLALWGLFMTVNAGTGWCLWTLAKEAHKHAAFHLRARRRRSGWWQRRPEIELPAGFAIIPAGHVPTQRPAVPSKLRLVG